MKLGNVTGDIYDRSVAKRLDGKREGICSGAGYGEDCAIFSCEGKKTVAAMSHTAYAGADCGAYAVFAAANQAAARGVEKPDGILLRILLPAGEEEGTLRRLVEDADRAAWRLGTALADVKVSVMPAVNAPVVSALATGCAGFYHDGEKGTAGLQVVMTKWAGLEGSALLASRYRERLCRRYPSDLIAEAAGFDSFLSVAKEAAVAGEFCGHWMCAAAEGGIFHALWTLAECAGTGLEVDLKKIPVRQETVEICNALDCNPYELLSNGSLLCLTEHGEDLLRALERMRILAAVIGRTTPSGDRLVINGEERRFLEPAKPDAFYGF